MGEDWDNWTTWELLISTSYPVETGSDDPGVRFSTQRVIARGVAEVQVAAEHYGWDVIAVVPV